MKRQVGLYHHSCEPLLPLYHSEGVAAFSELAPMPRSLLKNTGMYSERFGMYAERAWRSNYVAAGPIHFAVAIAYSACAAVTIPASCNAYFTHCGIGTLLRTLSLHAVEC
eukprot:4092830-Amphidinium_carterae.1